MVRMRSLLVIAVALAACHVSAIGTDGGTKADGSVSASLCTTVACAASPCTANCLYAAKVGACGGSMPSQISSDKILGCSNRCGLRSYSGNDTSGSAQDGYCWEFDPNAAGCVIPSCGFSSPQCTLVDNNFDTGGAAMCAAGWTCTDGATIPPADASAYCPDLAIVD
jgi:hypothetical protein